MGTLRSVCRATRYVAGRHASERAECLEPRVDTRHEDPSNEEGLLSLRAVGLGRPHDESLVGGAGLSDLGLLAEIARLPHAIVESAFAASVEEPDRSIDQSDRDPPRMFARS